MCDNVYRFNMILLYIQGESGESTMHGDFQSSGKGDPLVVWYTCPVGTPMSR